MHLGSGTPSSIRILHPIDFCPVVRTCTYGQRNSSESVTQHEEMDHQLLSFGQLMSVPASIHHSLNYLDGMGKFNFVSVPRLKAAVTRTFFTGKTTLHLGIRNTRWRNGPSTPVIWSTHGRVRLPTLVTFWVQRSHSTFSFLPVFEASYTRTCINLRFLRAKQLLKLTCRNP